MDDLLAEFVAETREMLESIEGEIVAWECDPSDRARLDTIFRFVHTVKGNCGFFDLGRLEKLSHAAESALSEVRAGNRQPDARLVNAVLDIIDRIREMADAIDAGEDFPAGGDEDLIAALEPDAGNDSEAAALSKAKAVPGKPSTATVSRSIRLPVDLLDRVMSGVSDLVLARNDLSRRVREGNTDPAVGGAFERLSAILDDLRDGVTRMRMQRIEHLFSAFPRLVRDLSADLGKQVMIDVEGGEVELDREMIEMIRDPLTHILRNALDHGIEPPSERLAAGKREIGTLLISARQSGNRILVAISDDGRGIDTERLVNKAVAQGVASESECAAMSEAQKLALVFEPGLSTAREITSVSGRGVGMDIVRANIEQVGGTITISSEAGEGTRFLLSLPLTLSIVPALTIMSGGQVFAIARSYVEEIVRSNATSLEFAMLGDARLAKLRGERIRCVTLGEVLRMGSHLPADQATLVLLRLAGGDLFALAVDRVIDHEDMVIKPLAPAIMDIGLYSGTTLLDDGQPVLMLDIAGIARSEGLLSDVRKRRTEPENIAKESQQTAEPALVVFTEEGRKRLVRLDLVSRIEKVPAQAIHIGDGHAKVVIGETIYPLAGLAETPEPDASVNLLRLCMAGREIAYAIRRVLDTASIAHEIVPAEDAGEVEGVTLVEGEAVEILNGPWLFANYNGVAPQEVVR